MAADRFAGVDWASEEHALCVVDGGGRIVEGRRYRHDERGIRALCARLIELDVQLVAIARPAITTGARTYPFRCSRSASRAALRRRSATGT